MSHIWVRGLEHLHGQVGWLAVAALLHPAILLRRARRRAILAAGCGTAAVTVAATLGATIYPAYRAEVKPLLFANEPAIGWAFERKEHLAIAAVALAWVGLGAHIAAWRRPVDEPMALHRVAFLGYASAAVAAFVTATLGVVIAVHRTF